MRSGSVRPKLTLLVDACLTPRAIPALQAAFGAAVDAVHVDEILPRGTRDDVVLDQAIAESRAIVTANVADFLALARSRPGHPGMLFITVQNTRMRQMEAITTLVGAVLSHVEAGGKVQGCVFVWRKAGARLAVREITDPLAKR